MLGVVTLAAARSAVMAALASGRGSKLASLLEELGYPATATEATAASVVKYASDSLDPAGVAAALGVIVRTAEAHAQSDRAEALASAIGGLSLSDRAKGWNVNALVDAIKGVAPGLDWDAVAAGLDQPGFIVKDQAAFKLLVTMLRRAGLDGLPSSAVSIYRPRTKTSCEPVATYNQSLQKMLDRRCCLYTAVSG